MRKSNKLFFFNISLAIFLLIGLYFFDNAIGGNATNGKIENNIFFVQNTLGEFKKVSKFTYIANYLYTSLTALFILLGAVSAAILQFRFVNFCKNHK